MADPATTRVYLARHCDVRNPEGVLYGYLPDFPLSEKGVAQAHAMGRRLAATPARTIWASPLLRAQQTAEIVASHLDGATVHTTDDLAEARFGIYLQGVKPKDVPWRRPLWFVHMVWPGLLRRDESVPAMAARVQRPIDRILAEHPGQGGICISHGDPIQAFWVRADGRPSWALHRLQCAKGGLLELDYEDGRLARTTYRSPAELGEPASAEPEAAGSHA